MHICRHLKSTPTLTNTNQEITSVKVQFPEEFQRVLVVAYKPTQVYVERKAISGPIKF